MSTLDIVLVVCLMLCFAGTQIAFYLLNKVCDANIKLIAHHLECERQRWAAPASAKDGE